jgi:acyl-coenzyme A thioesterase PaaI-like protein
LSVTTAEASDRLGAAMRSLADLVVRTAADADQLNEAAIALDRVRDRLAAAPRHERLHDSPFHPMSIVGGTAHPIAPQLRVRADGDGVAGTVTLGPAYEGGPGLVHGGVLSLLIDHTMGQALFVAGHAAMTVSLEVRYRAPTPLDTELRVSARLARVEGRKLFVDAEIRVADAVTVQAHGVFIALTLANVAAIFPAERIPQV